MSDRRCTVRIGPKSENVVVEIDGVDLVKRSYLTGLNFAMHANDPPELTLHILQPEMLAADVRWMIPEDELRWLAEAHGYDLVKRRLPDDLP